MGRGVWIVSQNIPDEKSRLDLTNLHELRGKRLVAQVSQTRLFALYLRTEVVLMLQLELSPHWRSVDHVPTYSGRKIAVGPQKPSRITRQNTCCASESNTSVRILFANRSGFDAPIGVVLAWEERGSCLNIFRTKNHGRILETFTNYEAKYLMRKSVDHVSTYSGRQIAVGSQKPSRITMPKTCCAREWLLSQHIPDDNSRSDLRNLHELRGKRIVAQVSQTRQVRIVFANRSGFDAPIGVVLAREERGSCLNIFRMTNPGRIFETFTKNEAKDLLRTRLGMGGTWIMSQLIPDDKSRSDLRNLHELRGKRLDAQVSQTRRFANRSGFDAPIGVVLAWEDRESCLNIFRMTNRGRISETFMNYEAKDLLLKSVDHVSTYSRRQIAVGSHKPSRITREKTCCASESNTSVHEPEWFLCSNWSCLCMGGTWIMLNVFRMTNRGRISETFMSYEAKDLLRK
ncbi:uncharacterized protein G2W53_033663 [Senna tora]|uniref:Uncharacterized protein n=1 Tax=Senna tora TaxID=362788 RepID=A0A834T2L6_9FABA|nr:uncharacterized protein G2W53_033663 [Senna tora]